ncbi:ATP-binding protein [Alteromonas sp. MTD1]|uniref:ATP-binding protein n=1 Tax=Alteromonas sp. MTD1 TaxID=3057962 RepID=UPI0036F43680
MSNLINAEPSPRSHIETLRKMGYTLQSAVGDIVDNSISAESNNISIVVGLKKEIPYLAIIDDGAGMYFDELISNLRIGCKDPIEKREKGDLGRFGSGMKTASFSQTKYLTVITKSENEEICAAKWDLDLVKETNQWLLKSLDHNEIKDLLKQFEFNIGSSGTIILWESLDKYATLSSEEAEEVIKQDVSDLRSFVGLYFHKFFTNPHNIKFDINRIPLRPIDPFLVGEPGYHEGQEENFRVKGGKLNIKVHILPHESKIRKSKLIELGGVEGISAKQGLYIYREQRLIVAGGWQNLARLSQLGKLARIEVNVPSSVDDEWSTDVKKSSLQIPKKVRDRLRHLISNPIEKAKRVVKFKGEKELVGDYWSLQRNPRNDKSLYLINPKNEKIRNLMSSLSFEQKENFKHILCEISHSLPTTNIYYNMSTKPQDIDQGLEEMTRIFKELMNEVGSNS